MYVILGVGHFNFALIAGWFLPFLETGDLLEGDGVINGKVAVGVIADLFRDLTDGFKSGTGPGVGGDGGDDAVHAVGGCEMKWVVGEEGTVGLSVCEPRRHIIFLLYHI